MHEITTVWFHANMRPTLNHRANRISTFSILVFVAQSKMYPLAALDGVVDAGPHRFCQFAIRQLNRYAGTDRVPVTGRANQFQVDPVAVCLQIVSQKPGS